MAVYPCEAEHESELSFQVGAIFSAGKCYRSDNGRSLTLKSQRTAGHIGFREGTGNRILNQTE